MERCSLRTSFKILGEKNEIIKKLLLIASLASGSLFAEWCNAKSMASMEQGMALIQKVFK